MARILSIEDDTEFQQVLGHALGVSGYEVFYAFSGLEGYEKALALLPDLIICDIMLPGLNGIEVIEMLRRHEAVKAVPLIVTTAYWDGPCRVEPQERASGTVEYLPKPIRLTELRRLIGRLLRPLPAALPCGLSAGPGRPSLPTGP